MPESREVELPELIRARLGDLDATALEIEDQSAAHAGHAGAKSGAHFRLHVVSAAFAGQPRVLRHRMIYERLAGLLPGRIHALTMTLVTPDELGRQST